MNPDTSGFYESIRPFRGFGQLMDPKLYMPLPEGWVVGISDIVDSTKAIGERRYKTVNMAGAAVIAAVTNVLDQREFPFVFGGDGASFAVPPGDAVIVREAMAATAAWVRDDLGLEMRVAQIPVAEIRARGVDVLVARFAPSLHVSYAMFAGGGLGWAEAAIKRGEFAIPPADDAVPDLSGLSCRFEEIPARRGIILSVIAVPVAGAADARYRQLVEEIVALVEGSPEAGRPVPASGPDMGWPPGGFDLEVRATKRRSRVLRRVWVAGYTLFSYLILKSGIPIGGFVPKKYIAEVVANTDFRKFDDGLRMILDCTGDLADLIERRLAEAASQGIVRYGMHRQGAAMMTCFTPSPSRSDHVHFVDGASGGYAAAAAALKALRA